VSYSDMYDVYLSLFIVSVLVHSLRLRQVLVGLFDNDVISLFLSMPAVLAARM